MEYFYLVVALILLFFSEKFYFKLADKYNIIDRPNERSSHTKVTLRGGGVVFYMGVLLFSIITKFNYPWFFAGLTLITAVSFIDDIKSLPSKTRLACQFISILLMFMQWGLYSGLDFWYLMIALVFCTGVLNAYNFMDGINGMTGGYSIAVLLPLALLNRSFHFVDERLLYISIIALAVFCFFNFRTNAKCFAGDVGSVCMGFIVIFSLGLLILKTGNFFYIIFLAIYGVDSVITIMRRILLRENIFQPHRRHAFQILVNEFGIPHVSVSFMYAILQGAISFGAIYWCPRQFQLAYFAIVMLVLVSGYFAVLGLNLKQEKRLASMAVKATAE